MVAWFLHGSYLQVRWRHHGDSGGRGQGADYEPADRQIGEGGVLIIFTSERRQANERVNGLWLSNEGGGAVNFLSRTFVNIAPWGPKDDATWIIQANELKLDIRCDLWGHLEASMASEATKMAVWVNMHMDGRVTEVVSLESDIKFNLWASMEATVSSEAIQMAVKGNMQGNWACWFQVRSQISNVSSIS